MNYNNDFKLSDLFTNEQYKARTILIFFLIIIIILTVMVRTTDSKPVNKDKEDNGKENPPVEEQVTPGEFIHSKEDELDETSLYNRFSFLRLNNYEFNFVINSDSVVNINGKRFDNKMQMMVQSGKEAYEYQVRNNMVKARVDGEFRNTDLPYVVLNFFDNVELYNLIRYSNLVNEEDEYIDYDITNEKLLNILPSNIANNVYIEKMELKNNIRVYLTNNKITRIEINMTNFILKVQGITKLEISLNYEKIGQVDDFSIEF